MRRSTLQIRIKMFVVTCICVFAWAGQGIAAEIKALLPLAMRGAMSELGPQFEKTSGNKLTIEYGTIGAVTDRLKKGEAADVAIVSDAQAADLQREGKLASQQKISRTGIGGIVPKGAAKPDFSSVEAFKQSMLAAKSVLWADPSQGGPSGTYMSALMERLGIAAEMKPKTVLVANQAQAEAVVSGRAEIGFDQMSGIISNRGVDFVGPLPQAIQNYTSYVGGVVAISKQKGAAQALLAFLTSPSAQQVMKQKGFESF